MEQVHAPPFLSQNFQWMKVWGAFYKEEQTTGQVALVFSFLAIFIACMGLYSLLALTTVYRTKEIGDQESPGSRHPGINIPC